MNELIKVNYENERPTVLGRDLHEFLEVKTEYKDWFPRMVEYGFNEGIDFSSFLSESTGGRPSINHQLTIDMAKEIAMVQRNEKGKEARRYFIELEKQWNSPESVMSRALKMADKTIASLGTNIKLLENKIEKQKPKVLFAEALTVSDNTILIGELAKLLKQNGIEVGQNRLFEKLRLDGYLGTKGEYYNMPTQRAMELKLFEIKTRSVNNPDGSVRVTKTTVVTGKGQIYFVNKFLDDKKVS